MSTLVQPRVVIPAILLILIAAVGLMLVMTGHSPVVHYGAMSGTHYWDAKPLVHLWG